MGSSFFCRTDFGGLSSRLRSCFQCCCGWRPAAIRSTAAFIGALTIVLTTTFGIGFFGDASFPISERILGAQASILAVSLCTFVLAALFAERRLHETELVASGTRLQEALTELRLLYENAPIGLAFLTPDCRYRQINRRLTEICGLSIADHIGKSVRCAAPRRGLAGSNARSCGGGSRISGTFKRQRNPASPTPAPDFRFTSSGPRFLLAVVPTVRLIRPPGSLARFPD